MKIVLYVLMGFLLTACNDDTPTQNKIVEQKTQVKEQSKMQAKVETAKDAITEVAKEAKETTTEAAKEAQETITEVAKDITQKAQELTKEVADAVKQETSVAKKDGSALYKSCAACHGADGSKVALGKSEVIKGWSAQKTVDALNGYKDGTYGGAMKGLMSGQVKNLSSQDIEALAEHIAKF